MMQENERQLDRRGFLRLGTLSALAAGVEFSTSRSQAEQQGTRPVPAHPVLLHSESLQVTLDGSHGVPFEYRLPHSGTRFSGETQDIQLKARVCCKQPWGFVDVDVLPSSQDTAPTFADFHFEAMYAAKISAAKFTLRYAIEKNTIWVTLEDVQEQAGFELISITMPALVTVPEHEPEAWLAHGDTGGDLVKLNQAKAGHLAPNSFWGEIHSTLPVIMAGHSGAVCVQETTAYMDGTLMRVTGEAPQRRGSLGTTKMFRVDGSACYNMNLGAGVPWNCGNQATPNLLVGQKSTCRLDFLEPAAATKPLTWIDGAKLVRARMPPIPNRFYDDKFIYGIRTDEPKFPQPSATFAHCEEMIRTMHALTDGSPQLVHLWGWQFRGKDTGYPAVNVVDERLGGYDAMMQLKSHATTLNTTVSLSDNYDDAYRSSPAWNEAMIARKPDGELWKSREWTGEESYIQGLAKYMEGPGPERVRYTCERYQLPGTIHVDVLSYFAIRNDWDPKHPASGIRNLVAGRYKVMEEFAKYNVDVTSEGLRYPYIGKMSMSWYAGGPTPCPLGGKPIPLLSLIYRQSAVWGRASSKGVENSPQQAMMFYGEAQHNIFNGDTPIETMLDSFYLVMVPWFRVNHTDIEGFERTGDKTVTELAGQGNRIEIDWSTKNYRLILEGAEVARLGATFCPLGKDRIAMYTVRDEELTATLPQDWDPSTIKAVALYSDHKEPVKFNQKGRQVAVQMQVRRPVILSRT